MGGVSFYCLESAYRVKTWTRGETLAPSKMSIMNERPFRRPRLAILTNLLAPYRIPLFQDLTGDFDVTIVTSGKESNREEWDDLEREAHGFRLKRSMGFTLRWRYRADGEVLDTRHLHVNPGLILDLLRIRPGAIISIEMGFRSLVAVVYGSLFNCPVWLWWGGTIHTERSIGRIKRVFRKFLARAVDRWFSYGVTSTEYLISLNVARHKIVELQNCIPQEMYREPSRPALQLEPRPVLLCVGQLIPRKGVDLLLDAAAKLQAEGLTFSTMIVGGGPEKPRLEERVRQLRLREVHFHAPEPPHKMPSIYRSADVFVFPTREDVWGLVANEALWSGLPALISIYAGCAREVVPSASTFDPLDTADFVAKLRCAVQGQLPPPDLKRLQTVRDVSARIIAEVEATLSRSQ
jgi:glycosyltransferase involved in cell wall biosynthesis